MTFKDFLKQKGISEDDFPKMEIKEIAKIHNEYNESVRKEMLTKFEGVASVSEVKSLQDSFKTLQDANKELTEKTVKGLQDTIKNMGLEVTKLKEDGKGDEAKSLTEQIKEKKEAIQKLIDKEGNVDVVLKANVVRGSITGNTQSMNLPDIGQLAHRKLTLYDLFTKVPVSESNNNGVVRYWDWDAATIVRAAATRAEGTAFPASTAKWVLGTINLEKIGDTLPVSAEFEEDEEMFAAELDLFLQTNVSLEMDTQLANGDGITPNIKGLVTTVGAYAPVASGIADARIYDLIVKVSEDITATGGSKYTPDFAVMNISDINKMKLKKDANNNYIIPPFVDRDGKNVAGVIVIESNVITANTMVVGDRRFARIYEKAGIVLSKGFVNAQFIEDMSTLKARKRMAFLIRGADLGGFKKVTSISAALVTLAT